MNLFAAVTTPVGEDRPRPLRVLAVLTGSIGALVQAVLAVLIGFGVIEWTPDQVALILGAVGVMVAMLTALVTAWYGETKVTPLSDPMNNAGDRLIPAP